MDVFSLLSGIDSLRKLAVILGVILMGFGVLYPIQKTLELKSKQILLEEAQKLNSVELNNINKELIQAEEVIKSHKFKLSKLNLQKDSLLKCNFTESAKYIINSLQNEITFFQTKDEELTSNIKQRTLNVENTFIKSETLAAEIVNIESFISKYNCARWVCVLLGGFLFINGILKWNTSQKESDRLKNIEIQIKSEELKKLQRENTP